MTFCFFYFTLYLFIHSICLLICTHILLFPHFLFFFFHILLASFLLPSRFLSQNEFLKFKGYGDIRERKKCVHEVCRKFSTFYCVQLINSAHSLCPDNILSTFNCVLLVNSAHLIVSCK
jgi:hypothetical protein